MKSLTFDFRLSTFDFFPMEFNETKEGNVAIVTITGKLDSTNYIGVEKKLAAIIDRGGKTLLADCTELDYISSAGLRTMLGILKSMKTAEGTFALCSLKTSVKKIFEVSGFLKLFPVYENREEALSQIDSVG